MHKKKVNKSDFLLVLYRKTTNSHDISLLIMFVYISKFCKNSRTREVTLLLCQKTKDVREVIANFAKKKSFSFTTKKVSSTFSRKKSALLRWPCKYIPWYSARSPPFFTNFIQRTFLYKAQCSINGKKCKNKYEDDLWKSPLSCYTIFDFIKAG